MEDIAMKRVRTPLKRPSGKDEDTKWVRALAHAIIVQAAEDFRSPCGVSDPEIRGFFLSGWFNTLSGSRDRNFGKRVLKRLDKEAAEFLEKNLAEESATVSV